LSFN
jgi:hypothetical protein